VRRSARFTLLLLCAACRREPSEKPVAVIDARPAATAPVTAPTTQAAAPSAPQRSASAAVYDPTDPLTVPTLEVSGEVQLAPEASPPKRVFVYISSGDCLEASAPLLRRMPVTETGTFLAHVAAQPGTELSLCAAGELVPGGPSTLYGKYGKPVRVGAEREQEVRDVKINLAVAAPRQFPTPPKK
jgi:hypothetical protein